MTLVVLAAVLLCAAPAIGLPATAGSSTIRINIGNALGAPGDSVQVTVSLDASGGGVAATANDITFNTTALSLDPGACRVNTSIGKSISASTIRNDATATTVRVLVQSAQNTDPIPNGALYTCALRISTAALPGAYRLDNELALVTTPEGATITGVDGAHGAVTVSLVGRACSGDCNGDGEITVDEVISGVNIALGNRPIEDCLSLDPNGDGAVTINELIAAVANAVNGCILPPTPVPTATSTPTPVPVRFFVRVSGSDTNNGLDPTTALRTITEATRIAQNGYEIIVGPGTYEEGVTTASSGRAPQRLSFIADVTGAWTGDAAGPVLIDATGSGTAAGFKFSNTTGYVIDGFTITGAADGGIVIKSGSTGATIRNCTLFNNPGAGLRAQDAIRITIFNNLIYNNGAQGVAIVGTITGSPNARILSNTIAGNGDRGITIGTTRAPSEGALVRNNILQDNGTRTEPRLENIKVFTSPHSEVGYSEDYNLIFPPSYLPISLAGPHDVIDDATFVFASGADYHLRSTSLAIDAGAALPPEFEAVLFNRTTTGAGVDTGLLDLGFHFAP